MPTNDGTGTYWNETDPLGNLPARDGQVQLRDLRKGVNLRQKKEHVVFGDNEAGGEHKAGSAVAYLADTTAAPTMRPDGLTAFTADDAGRLWIDKTSNVLKYRTAAGAWTSLFSTTVIDGGITYAKLGADITAGLAKEIGAPTDPNRPWLSLDGTARPFYGNYNVTYPTKRPDGVTNLDANDSGRIAINWNSSKYIKTWTGAAWEDVTIAPAAPADGSVTLAKLTGALQGLLNVRITKGNYTGNGTATKAVTGLGFQPDYVLIVNLATGQLSIMSQTFGTVIVITNSTITAAGTMSLDADGFTIKTSNANVNQNTTVYGWLALKVNA